MTSAGGPRRAGLAPARDGAPDPAGERIHVVGAAGAGASAAALLAARAGRGRDRLRPGRAVAVHAGPRGARDRRRARARRRARDDGTAARPAGRDEGPDRDRPGQPELVGGASGRRSRSSRGSRSSPTPRSGGRSSAWPGRTARARRPAGWSTSWSRPGRTRRRSSGRCCRPTLTGGPPATARSGRGPAFVVEADEYAGNFDAVPAGRRDPDQRGVGPPRRLRRPGRRRRRVRGLAAAALPDGRHARRQRRRRRASRTSSIGCADWPGRIVAYALVDGQPGSGAGTLRGDRASGSPRPPGRPRRCSAGSPRPTGRRRRSRSTASTSWPGRSTVRLRDGRPPQRGERARRSPARPQRSASRPRRSPSGLASFAGRRPAPGAQGRGGRRRGLRRLRPPPDGDPRDARRGPPARAGPARSGRSTSR